MKILNYGSLNIDKVYQVEHFVSPGETISSIKMDIFPGGKGLNQSIALARAGASVYHAGTIGEDGLFLKEALEKSGVDCRYIEVTDSPTGHANIQVDKKGENAIILFKGSNFENSKDKMHKVMELFIRIKTSHFFSLVLIVKSLILLLQAIPLLAIFLQV